MCLLGRTHNFRPRMYSTLAGFVEPGESLEEAVAREVYEEVGVWVGEVHYLGSQPWPFPSSLLLGFHAVAERSEEPTSALQSLMRISYAFLCLKNKLDHA